MKTVILTSLFLLLCCLSVAYAVPDNAPFFPQAKSVEKESTSGLLHDLRLQFNQLQKQLKDRIVGLANSLRQGDRSVTVMLIGLAFLYGIIHAAGPGHGKAIIASYLLTQQVPLRRGVFIAVIGALLHGASAIVLVLLIYFLSLGRVSMTFGLWSSSMQLLAYALISLLGLFLVGLKVAHIAGKRSSAPAPENRQRQSWWLFAALALVPCPGTMIVLLFFMSQKMLGFGILMAVLMALGMAVTLAVVGFGAGLTQSFIETSSDRAGPGFWAFAHDCLGLLGALSVLIVGVLLLLSVC